MDPGTPACSYDGGLRIVAACRPGVRYDAQVAVVLDAFREAPHRCSYLPAEQASLEVRVAVDVTPGEFGGMLARGWRRFGPSYFRPACAACHACVPTRIPVATFRPSRSQRRARRLTSRLTRIVDRPRVDRERLDVHARWHRNREHRRGWDPSPLGRADYETEFAFPHPSVREVAFRDPQQGDRLVGLGIVDEVPDALSAVYFFWDPGRAPSSLGTGHIVRLVEDAAERGLAYVYLGYRVAACPSMAYKERFQPQESLCGRPSAEETPTWARHRDPVGP
jgi:arginyl-tRNA--protein-N-Asp/Glu arginylyltransferase